MEEKPITRVQRLLGVYHLFQHCQEVSFQEIEYTMPSVAKLKTFHRDVKLLQDIGVISGWYSNKAKAYISEPYFTHVEPKYPESEAKRKNLVRIRRLCDYMQRWNQLHWEESLEPLHIKIYDEMFPGLSKRTRDRDIAELRELGYGFDDMHDIFVPEDEDKEKDIWEPRKGYCYEAPVEAWALSIFSGH